MHQIHEILHKQNLSDMFFLLLQEFEQADIVWVVANAERAQANETPHVSLYKIMKSSIFYLSIIFWGKCIYKCCIPPNTCIYPHLLPFLTLRETKHFAASITTNTEKNCLHQNLHFFSLLKVLLCISSQWPSIAVNTNYKCFVIFVYKFHRWI